MNTVRQYSPKEIAAFEGLLQLAQQGRNFSSIKVQDIASAAGIGKGTLYEYFSSKNEILSGAIVYALDDILTCMENAMQQHAILYDVITHFLSETEDRSRFNFASLMGLTASVPMQEREEFQHNEELMNLLTRMESCKKRLYRLGRASGEIAEETTEDYFEYVMLSGITGYISNKMLCCRKQPTQTDMQYTADIICRSLGK